MTMVYNKYQGNVVYQNISTGVAGTGMLPPLLLLLILATVTAGNYPVLDVATSMRMLLVPVDAKVGSAIYRLRGTDSDFDFPLQFDIIGK
jgi:hypothetical protein